MKTVRGRSSTQVGRIVRRRWLPLALVAVVVVVAALVAWALWPESPRSREYRSATACLLTDADGIAGQQASAVWAGMQAASLETLVKVQYLEVDGPQDVENARTFLAGLASGRCAVVLAAGSAQNEAVHADAARYPDITFVVTAARAEAAAPNVLALTDSSPDAVRAGVQRELTQRFG